jgi:hypothetical protein
MLARNQQVRCGVQVVKEPKGRRQAINRLMAQLFATYRAIFTSIVTGEGALPTGAAAMANALPM